MVKTNLTGLRLIPIFGRVHLRLSVYILWSVLALALCSAPASTLSASQTPPNAAMSKAVLLLKQGHYRKAIEVLKQLNARQGNKSAECYWRLAQAYWGLKDVKKTEESCDQVLRYAAKDVQLAVLAHELKGAAAESAAFAGERAKFQEAIREFRAAYELDKGFPGRANILVNLGLAQLHAGDTAQGIATLKDFLSQAPQGELADRVRKVLANPRRASPNAAPNFSLVALDGQTYSLAKLRGKIVLLDFWATWCTSCRESIPALERLARKFSKAPFIILSVNGDDSAQGWRKYVERESMDWPQYYDADGRVARLFGIHYLPTYILIDADGIIVTRQVGWAPGLERIFQEQISKRLRFMDSANAQPPRK